MPPPTMKLSGACSLKRKSSPGTSDWKPLGLGDQKLTSSGFRSDKKLNQSPSVTPTKTLATAALIILDHGQWHPHLATAMIVGISPGRKVSMCAQIGNDNSFISLDLFHAVQ